MCRLTHLVVRTTTDEGKGTLEIISSNVLKQNIVAGGHNFGFLPEFGGKIDPLKHPLPMNVTGETKEDNDESCLIAPAYALTDNHEEQEPIGTVMTAQKIQSALAWS